MQVSELEKNRMPAKSLMLIVCLVTLLALFLRIQYVQQTEIDQPIRSDAQQYVIYGYNLYAHGIFSREIGRDHPPKPDAYRSPGYPAFIALAFFLGGGKGCYPVVIYLQIVLSALLVPLTIGIGSRVLPYRAAIIAGVLTAVSPHLIAMTSYVLAETLYAFFLSMALFFYGAALKNQKRLFFILAGVFSGAAYFTNETFFFLPYLFALCSFWCIPASRKPKKLLMNICIYGIVFSLFPLSWEMRNHANGISGEKGKIRAIRAMSHGAYPDFIYKNAELKYNPYKEDPMQPVFGSSLTGFFRILKDRVFEDPCRYIVWYLVKKPYYVWSWDNLESRLGETWEKGTGDIYVYPVKTSLYFKSAAADLSRIVMKYLHPVFLLAACAGIPVVILEMRRKAGRQQVQNSAWLLCIVIVYYTLLYTVFAPWPRYSIPLRPELYLFAVWAILHVFEQLKKRKT